jgi:hypothetical protein
LASEKLASLAGSVIVGQILELSFVIHTVVEQKSMQNSTSASSSIQDGRCACITFWFLAKYVRPRWAEPCPHRRYPKTHHIAKPLHWRLSRVNDPNGQCSPGPDNSWLTGRKGDIVPRLTPHTSAAEGNTVQFRVDESQFPTEDQFTVVSSHATG